MKKFLAGTFALSKERKYYTNDFETFYDENDKRIDDDILEDWAVCLNSPWSQVHEKYRITCNCKDAYTEMVEGEPIWKCEYSIIGYDGIFANVFGYGEDEAEALKECISHFKYLQKEYNSGDESF